MQKKETLVPNTLPSGGGLLVKSGPARETGGTLYSNLASGRSIAVFSAVISMTGQKGFSIATVVGNSSLNKVVVPERAFAVTHSPSSGEMVLIGDLAFGDGPLPRANVAWPAANGDTGGHSRRVPFSPRPPAPRRFDSQFSHGFPAGTVIRVRDGYAVIQQDNAERSLLGLRTQFADTRDMQVGRRVTFQVASSQGKALAISIRGAR